MKTFAVLAGAGLMALGFAGAVQAQAPASGTAASPFPYAAPHEVETVNGQQCRTVYDDRSQRRVPVECVGAAGAGTAMVAPAPRMVAPQTTGAVSGTAASPFPYAARHEVETINGRQCRTVYDDRSQKRVPVECVQ